MRVSSDDATFPYPGSSDKDSEDNQSDTFADLERDCTSGNNHTRQRMLLLSRRPIRPQIRRSQLPNRNQLENAEKACSSFTPEELLLLSWAYVKVSCNTKHDTDEIADKLWEEIAHHYEELVQETNSINKLNVEYIPIKISHNSESLPKCWQQQG